MGGVKSFVTKLQLGNEKLFTPLQLSDYLKLKKAVDFVAIIFNIRR